MAHYPTKSCGSKDKHAAHVWVDEGKAFACGGYTPEAGYTVYEVTIRIPVDASEASPDRWAWEELLDCAVEIVDCEHVESFKSDDFQRIYEETQDGN